MIQDSLFFSKLIIREEIPDRQATAKLSGTSRLIVLHQSMIAAKCTLFDMKMSLFITFTS